MRGRDATFTRLLTDSDKPAEKSVNFRHVTRVSALHGFFRRFVRSDADSLKVTSRPLTPRLPPSPFFRCHNEFQKTKLVVIPYIRLALFNLWVSGFYSTSD